MNTEKKYKTIDELKASFKTAAPKKYIAAREQSARKMFLTPYTAEQLAEKGARIFLTDDGAGFALTANGDMIGVFNNSGRSGAGVEAVILGIAEGAKTLDCIGSHLENYYARFGFVEKERMKWDDERAPDGWEYSLGGRPDVVFFEYPDNLGRDPVDVARRFELARNRQISGGTLQSGGDTGVDSGAGKQVWSGKLLGEQETPPGPTGTASDVLADNYLPEGSFIQRIARIFRTLRTVCRRQRNPRGLRRAAACDR
jgi:hypothetical protein